MKKRKILLKCNKFYKTLWLIIKNRKSRISIYNNNQRQSKVIIRNYSKLIRIKNKMTEERMDKLLVYDHFVEYTKDIMY